MPHLLLNDPVDVIVTFCGATITPVRIRWNTQTYTPTQVNLVHRAQQGTTRLFYFSVSDATNFFKLQFNTDTLAWHLVEFYSD